MKKFFLTISILCFFVGQQSYAGNKTALKVVTVSYVATSVLQALFSIGFNGYNEYLYHEQGELLRIAIPIIVSELMPFGSALAGYVGYKCFVDNDNCCYDS